VKVNNNENNNRMYQVSIFSELEEYKGKAVDPSGGKLDII